MSLSNNFPALRPSLLLDFAGSETIDPRITFARASTARFYDQNTVAKAEENLLTRSQEFNDASWAKTNTAVTANTSVAPDGTTTAETVTAEASASSRKTISAGLFTLSSAGANSVYVKAGTLTKVALREGNAVGNWASFDLSGGTVIASAAAVTASIVNAGNGWYRCQMVNPTTGSVSLQILLLDGAYTNTDPWTYTWTSVGTETLLLWGAQLEQRSAPTAYTATTTAPITRYQPQLMTAAANVARLDHDPITREARGLLIEESRSNLVTFSEDWANAAWAKYDCTVSSNAGVAPDGTQTADLVIPSTSVATHYTDRAPIAVSSNGTASVYAKAGGYPRISLRSYSSNNRAVFDLSAGTVVVNSANSASITPVGNGWFRCSINDTGNANFGYGIYVMQAGQVNEVGTYAGDGYSGVFLWGAQLEVGAFATSYIARLDATAASRAADAASMTGTNFSSWFSAGEGTFYSDVASSATSFAVGARAFTATLLNSTAEQVCIDSAVTRVRSNGVDLGAFYLTTSIVQKRTVAYAQGQQAASAAGAVVESTTAGIPRGLDTLYVGANSLGTGGFLNGHLRKLAFYPRRLTNAQLQALTR